RFHYRRGQLRGGTNSYSGYCSTSVSRSWTLNQRGEEPASAFSAGGVPGDDNQPGRRYHYHPLSKGKVISEAHTKDRKGLQKRKETTEHEDYRKRRRSSCSFRTGPFTSTTVYQIHPRPYSGWTQGRETMGPLCRADRGSGRGPIVSSKGHFFKRRKV